MSTKLQKVARKAVWVECLNAINALQDRVKAGTPLIEGDGAVPTASDAKWAIDRVKREVKRHVDGYHWKESTGKKRPAVKRTRKASTKVIRALEE